MTAVLPRDGGQNHEHVATKRQPARPANIFTDVLECLIENSGRLTGRTVHSCEFGSHTARYVRWFGFANGSVWYSPLLFY